MSVWRLRARFARCRTAPVSDGQNCTWRTYLPIGSDNAIRGIFGISRWKSNGAHARAATDRQDDEPGLNFLEEGFEANVELDAALTRECC